MVAGPALALAVVCAVAVRCTTRGPVLFRQQRVGRDGHDFELLKFRSMVDAPNPIIPDDHRITAVGRLLRATSLDELPQLWNVVRGDMSVVGPRPTLRYQVDQYDGRQRHRLDVRPGLTGFAQINGRNAISWDERIELDLRYVRCQSPTLDLQILVRTPRVLLSGEGASGHDPADPIVAGRRRASR